MLDPPDGAQAVGTNVVPSILATYRINPISFNSSTITFYAPGLNYQHVQVTGIPSADRLSVAFTPLTPLQPTTSYCLNLSGVTDQMGVVLNNYPNSNQTCFVTGPASDTVHPTVVSVSPPNQSINVPINVLPSVLIGEPVNPISATTAAVVLTGGGQGVQGTVVLAPDFETVTFTPAANLAANTSYTLAVSGFPISKATPLRHSPAAFRRMRLEFRIQLLPRSFLRRRTMAPRERRIIVLLR